MNIAGFSLSNWMTYGFSFLDGSITWRFPIAFQLVFSFILLSTAPWLPESPRWLLAHDHYREGLQVLAALEGNGATATDEVIVDHAEEILAAVRAEREKIPMLQNSVGLSNNLSRLLAACNSVSYLIFSFAGLVLIERAGRRKMMMWGAAGQFICYAFVAALLTQTDDPVHGKSFGAGATTLSMRNKGAALGTASNWYGVTPLSISIELIFQIDRISNYMVVQITPIGIANLGWKFYLIWMSFNAIFVPLIWFVYPETANRHLEDIDKLYRDNSSMIFVYKNKEATQVERPQRFIDADRERLEVTRKLKL
ncbi:hypothetical protein C0989_004201 [Termitomyces sp. Mn162]|nr:hypothetical protein C0989_004201 [Termitomyces sp. Mn162]